MNKRILISLSVIGAVAAIAVGGTIAYFSDVETSTGNTFTAGRLDLIVDINGRVVNPLNEPIFSVTDMKPGDSGEKTISLTVDNNPSCGFVSFNLTSDLDNTCTEPEAAEEGVGCPLPENAPTEGELNDNVVWSIWSDMGTALPQVPECANVHPGDNVYSPLCGDVQLTSGNLVGSYSWSIGELPVTPNQQYYGIKWELPSTVTNIAQSDSFTADMILSAQQKRNRDFGSGIGVCPALGVVRAQ
jgi:Ca-activated chloride channel family protein